MLKNVIAIDGGAGSGKSTVSRILAGRLGACLLDTGAIYRALALHARNASICWDDASALGPLAASLPLVFTASSVSRDHADAPSGKAQCVTQRVILDGTDVSERIRHSLISEGASRVSRHPQVRANLLDVQRQAAHRGLLIAEGRDMGTVVFPDAPLKIFLSASAQVRAKRRMAEYVAAGEEVTLKEVCEAIEARDAADSARATAPLMIAEDAHRIDTGILTVDEIVSRITELAAAHALA